VSMTQVVRGHNLTRRYGSGEAAVTALDGADIGFGGGRFAAVMGASGSGKSTLLHLLAGLDRPTEGTVVIDGVELGALDDRHLTRLRRDKIGFVFQSFNLLPVLDAEENILLPLSLAHKPVDREWFDQLVMTMGIGDRLRHRPAQLSGGQQQRVAVARALISRPAVIFTDEPTGNLDSKASEEVLTLLRKAVDELAQTVVMVTHDAHAASYADDLVVLADGRIVHQGFVESREAIVRLVEAY
jgi:putative ABC transport system ATP-binding protein